MNGSGGPDAMSLIMRLLQQPMNQAMFNRGQLPGQLSGGQNYYDRFQNTEYQKQLQTALAQLSERDRQHYLDLMKGVFKLSSDKPWGKEQQAATEKTAAGLATMGPTMAQLMPKTFDEFMGSQGSGLVFGAHVFDANRRMINPMTRGMGLTGQQSATLTTGMLNQMFGPGADPAQMSGLGGAQAGQMYSEMAQRGMIGRLSGDPRADAKAQADQLKRMSGAVKAMQEIFGDAGHPDAPMAQIFKALDDVTRGGLTNLNPEKLRDTVRRMKELGRMTGQGFGAVAGMAEEGSAVARSMGLPGQFGVATGTSAAAFGQAWTNLAGPQGFGGLSRKQAESLDIRLRSAAAVSSRGQVLGAVANMAEQGVFGKMSGEEIGGLLQQMAGMDRPQAMAFLQQQKGVSGATIGRFFASPQANQEAALAHGVPDIVRGQQRGEINALMERSLAGGAMPVLGGGGVANARGLSGVIARLMREGMEAMSRTNPELLNDTSKTQERNQRLKEYVRNGLGRMGAMDPGVERVLDEVIASASVALKQEQATNPGLQAYGSVGGLFSMQNPEIVGQGASNVMAANEAAKKATQMAGMDQSITRKIVDAIKAAGREPGKVNFWDIATKATGQSIEELKKRGIDENFIKRMAQASGLDPDQKGDTAERKPEAAGGTGGGEGGGSAMGGKGPLKITGYINMTNGYFEGNLGEATAPTQHPGTTGPGGR